MDEAVLAKASGRLTDIWEVRGLRRATGALQTYSLLYNNRNQASPRHWVCLRVGKSLSSAVYAGWVEEAALRCRGSQLPCGSEDVQAAHDMLGLSDVWGVCRSGCVYCTLSGSMQECEVDEAVETDFDDVR